MNIIPRAIAIPATVRRALSAIGAARDTFWSGVWWTALRRHIQEHRLAQALELSGEDSMEARSITERLRRLENGTRYWRTASPIAAAALKASEAAGVARSDLRILSLNRSLIQAGDAVRLRRTWWMPVLAVAAVTVTSSAWAYLVLVVVACGASLPATAAGIVAVTVYFWILWPGFGLLTTCELAAIRRSGSRVEDAAKHLPLSSATVMSLPKRDDHR